MIDGKLQLKHVPASKKSDINKTENIKNIITRYGIADQQKAGNQGRDDSVKQFNIYNPTLHIFNGGKIEKKGFTQERQWQESLISQHESLKNLELLHCKKELS